MANRTCVADSCSSGSDSCRGMCRYHYAKWWRENRPASAPRCDIDTCDRVAVTRGWCSVHYRRWQRNGDPELLQRVPQSGICSVEGCAASAISRAYCRNHYAIWSRNGTPTPVWLADRCLIVGCERAPLAKDLCHLHYYAQHRAANREAYRARSAKRRAETIYAVDAELVIRTVVLDRDDWTCQLCQTPIPDKAWPSPRSPSLDHVTPLSRGGTHTYANTQAAHLECNVRKATRLMSELALPFAPPR